MMSGHRDEYEDNPSSRWERPSHHDQRRNRSADPSTHPYEAAGNLPEGSQDLPQHPDDIRPAPQGQYVPPVNPYAQLYENLQQTYPIHQPQPEYLVPPVPYIANNEYPPARPASASGCLESRPQHVNLAPGYPEPRTHWRNPAPAPASGWRGPQKHPQTSIYLCPSAEGIQGGWRFVTGKGDGLNICPPCYSQRIQVTNLASQFSQAQCSIQNRPPCDLAVRAIWILWIDTAQRSSAQTADPADLVAWFGTNAQAKKTQISTLKAKIKALSDEIDKLDSQRWKNSASKWINLGYSLRPTAAPAQAHLKDEYRKAEQGNRQIDSQIKEKKDEKWNLIKELNDLTGISFSKQKPAR